MTPRTQVSGHVGIIPPLWVILSEWQGVQNPTLSFWTNDMHTVLECLFKFTTAWNVKGGQSNL